MRSPRVPAPGQDLRAEVRRLVVRARVDLLLRRTTLCLFYGLVLAVLAAAAAGSVSLSLRPWLLPCAAAAAGLVVGPVLGALGRIDARRLLIEADARLGSRELASTAFELAESGTEGRFTGAIIEDAAALLARTPPRTALGRLRLPFLPFIPLLAALTVLALVFPLDLRPLLAGDSPGPQELVDLGEDLRAYGEKLRDDAAGSPGRSLSLPQELAQLGRELSDRKVGPEEALERISEMEQRLQQEYSLQSRAAAPQGAPGGQGTENGQGGKSPDSADRAGRGSQGDADTGGSSADQSARKNLRDLGGARDALRDAKRKLLGRGSGKGDRSPSTAQGPSGSGAPGAGQGNPGSPEGSDAPGDGPPGPGNEAGPDGTSGPGTAPAEQKHGAPSPIQPGTGPGLQAGGTAGEGESTRLLARALPEWAGSQLPEGTTVETYARQAESALAHDEIPPALRQSVRDYFTAIGVSGGGSGK
jgi:hypothetical protein